MKDLTSLRLYARVARLGSFSAAAREAGLSQPQVSRIIADLEAELGARLLTRSTRVVTPTDAGEAFLTRIEPILLELDDIEQDVRGDGELRGLVRLSTTASFGVRQVIPRLAAFTARHPGLRLQLQLDDRRQDLVKDAVDVAIRMGQLPDSTATVRKLVTVPRVLVAAPAYLAEAGAPQSPDDLARHRLVGGTANATARGWTFRRGEEETVLRVEPQVSTDENEGLIAAAVAGLGVTTTSGWACRRELERGELVMLLTDWTLPAIPVHAYFPMGPATRKAARVLIDHLAEGFAAAARDWPPAAGAA